MFPRVDVEAALHPGPREQPLRGPRPGERARLVVGAVVQQHRLGDPVEVGARGELAVERRVGPRGAEPVEHRPGGLGTPGQGEVPQVVEEARAHRCVDHGRVDESGPDDQRVQGDAAAHRPAEHGHPVGIDVRLLLERQHGVDRVARVAEAGLALHVGRRARRGVTAVVGVQDGEAGPCQVVLLPRQSLARDVAGRVDVAVVEHDAGEAPRAAGPEQDPGHHDVAAAVAHLGAGVGVGLGDDPHLGDPRAAEGLAHQRRQRDRAAGRREGLLRRRFGRPGAGRGGPRGRAAGGGVGVRGRARGRRCTPPAEAGAGPPARGWPAASLTPRRPGGSGRRWSPAARRSRPSARR